MCQYIFWICSLIFFPSIFSGACLSSVEMQCVARFSLRWLTGGSCRLIIELLWANESGRVLIRTLKIQEWAPPLCLAVDRAFSTALLTWEETDYSRGLLCIFTSSEWAYVGHMRLRWSYVITGQALHKWDTHSHTHDTLVWLLRLSNDYILCSNCSVVHLVMLSLL